VYGLRPLWAQKPATPGGADETLILYPLFNYQRRPDGWSWSVFSLINAQSVALDPRSSATRGFDLWPFYFSRQTGVPETSYYAVFPLFGDVPYRFGQDRWTWALFPLYGRFEKRGVSTTTAPWPFVKVLRGEGNRGYELWPIFGWRAKPGVYREYFYLWPLGYRRERVEERGTQIDAGFLPFYALSTGPDGRSETYVWPFFGTTVRTSPVPYRETRYFWPLFVQGRGDDRFVNRWGPFYTHSNVKGVDKTWVAWPLWRTQRFTDAGIVETRRQLAYFLFHDTTQQRAGRPDAGTARKTHVWPLLSFWDNGAGRRQVQALSPFEVFFPHNENVRLIYTPLVALYRYDRTPAGERRHGLLWDFITWRRAPQESEWHLGPLFGATRQGAQRRYSVGAGLFGVERRAEGRGWRWFAFEFKRRDASRAPAASP
jgi:hypothetical protein